MDMGTFVLRGDAVTKAAKAKEKWMMEKAVGSGRQPLTCLQQLQTVLRLDTEPGWLRNLLRQAVALRVLKLAFLPRFFPQLPWDAQLKHLVLEVRSYARISASALQDIPGLETVHLKGVGGRFADLCREADHAAVPAALVPGGYVPTEARAAKQRHECQSGQPKQSY